MSAIWGIIDLTGDVEVSRSEEIMRLGYARCIIDKTEHICGNGYAVGCGIQYVTPQAQLEKLPIEEDEIIFTADAILDNRTELLERLHYKGNAEAVSDGRLLYEMFRKYGTACLNDLLGAYSFVYYDSKKEELYLVADSTGTRALHYLHDKGVIYFSTLFEPILKAAGHRKISDRWITDFLALDNMAWALDNDKTPYQEIYCVPAAHYLKITRAGIEKVRYWNPNTTEIKGKSDEEYKELFRKVYQESVQRVMRNQDITMMLSGGLDSTSVAALVLKQAKQTGQTLTSFTSIPEKDFKSKLSSYYITDESEAVQKTKEYFAGKGYQLNCEFIDMAGRNSWDDRKEELDILEMPYKSMQNLLWIRECMRQSYAKGVRIMLSGGYGNVTVSNSFQRLYQRELLKKMKWGQFIRECYLCGKWNGLTHKQTLKVAYNIVKGSLRKREIKDIDSSRIVNCSLLKEEWIEKEGFSDRVVRDYRTYQITDYERAAAIGLMMNDKIFYQSGETQTKHSLATGVIIRDPTMDKRMIELCMRLPLSCSSKDGVDRRLVREYLKEDMPAHVIRQGYYGLQSADTAKRVQKKGDRIFADISKILHSETAHKYLQVDKVDQYIEDMRTFDRANDNFQLLRLEYTALVIEYIDKNNSFVRRLV